MIQRIVIRGKATFDNDGCDFTQLKPINVIFGENGTGKTTISRILNAPDNFSDCIVEQETGKTLPVLVYNRDFCNTNLSELNNIAGVYTLGKDNVENQHMLEAQQKEYQELKDKIEQNKKRINSINNELTKLESAFFALCWNDILHSTNYSKFVKIFEGGRNSQKKFAQLIITHYEHRITTQKTLEDLSLSYDTIFAKEPQPIDVITYTAPDVNDIEVNSIWSTPIIGHADVDIAGLIKRYDISDWVQKGKTIIQHNNLDVCPFCQQPIDESFIKKLELLFDDRYDAQRRTLTQLEERYKSVLNPFINKCRSILENTELIKFFSATSLSENLNKLIVLFRSNTEKITSKILEPSRSISLNQSNDLLNTIISIIEAGIQKINLHNQAIKNIKTERDVLSNEIWSYIVCEHSSAIETFLKSSNNMRSKTQTLESQINDDNQTLQQINAEIIRLKSSMTSIETAIESINATLKFFNLTNFKLERKDQFRYTIKRYTGEDVNDTLSEGEKTFISFLYFYQLIKGGRTAANTNEDKIVVIDDPISSLDSNILYVVSSLIKELLKDISKDSSNVKQIFILTHNVFFHHDVTQRNRNNNERDKYAFWILYRTHNVTKAKPFESKNPITSNYSLLWHELKRIANDANYDCGIAQNIMRRIYDYYFKFIGHYDDDSIINSFNNESEQKICRSLLCSINDGSHRVFEDIYYVPGQISKELQLEVFKQIFQQMNHTEHYNMMWNNA